MKKMLIAIFAMVAICSVHAAALKWKCEGFYYTGMEETDTLGFGTSHEFKWALIDLGTSPDASDLSFANGEFSGTGTQLASGTVTDHLTPMGKVNTATAGNYYTMLIYSTESHLWGQGGIVQGVIASGNTLADVKFDAPGVRDPWNYGMKGILADKSSSSNVPEPTSMALLILGAAVFGLRRKIRG